MGGGQNKSSDESSQRSKKRKTESCENLLRESFSPKTVEGFRSGEQVEINSARRPNLKSCVDLKVLSNVYTKQIERVRDVVSSELKKFSSRHISRLTKNLRDHLPIEISETQMFIDPSYLIEECLNHILTVENLELLESDSVNFIIDFTK